MNFQRVISLPPSLPARSPEKNDSPKSYARRKKTAPSLWRRAVRDQAAATRSITEDGDPNSTGRWAIDRGKKGEEKKKAAADRKRCEGLAS